LGGHRSIRKAATAPRYYDTSLNVVFLARPQVPLLALHRPNGLPSEGG